MSNKTSIINFFKKISCEKRIKKSKFNNKLVNQKRPLLQRSSNFILSSSNLGKINNNNNNNSGKNNLYMGQKKNRIYVFDMQNLLW